MWIISIFKRDRRSGKDRRKSKAPDSNGQEKRVSQGRRSGKERRDDIGRRSGMYYTLSEKQKGTVESIINILEYEEKKRK